MTLLQFLQSQGYARRQVVDLLTAGTVFVDGKKIDQRMYELAEGQHIVIYAKGRGKQDKSFTVTTQRARRSEIILLNKPKGFVCSKKDKHNRTIYELLPGGYVNQWYYVGRLDKDSRGLVLLTNKTEVVHEYEHPRHGVNKEYLVRVDRYPRREAFIDIKRGVTESGELLKADHVSVDRRQKSGNWLKIILSEGKNRHIRRMLDAVGCKVKDLVRVREGVYSLAGVKPGKWKKVGYKSLSLGSSS